MRSLSSLLLAYVLSMLLIGTSPLGTGQGAHVGQLLDALIPHVHLIGGRVVSADAATPQSVSVQERGPTIGAGAGTVAAGIGLALTPPLPLIGQILPVQGGAPYHATASDRLPAGWADAPPDPPPSALS
jgi:hypothetical protein